MRPVVARLFNLIHLWFLYYLLLLYVLTLAVRSILSRPCMRAWGDRRVTQIFSAPASILWLVLLTGFCLWPMKSWFGADTPNASFRVSLPVLLLYGVFFVLGWLLHRQAHLLGHLVRHWRWQLGLALLLSIPLFHAFRTVQLQGMAGPPYPTLNANHFIAWTEFIGRLQSAHDPETVPADLGRLWQRIPLSTRAVILRLSESGSFDERARLAQELNRVLMLPGLFSSEPLSPDVRPAPEIAHAALPQNRAILDQLFAGSLSGDPRAVRWYYPAKLGYSVGYSLVMWLLVFGSLGFFQDRCPGHSAAWRYGADSSYWIYLIHLPLVPLLQIWIAPWPWPALLKFAFMMLVAFVILFGSYHYLVRSTFIGRLLNGQSHPFVAWPFSRAGLSAVAKQRNSGSTRQGSAEELQGPSECKSGSGAQGAGCFCSASRPRELKVPAD